MGQKASRAVAGRLEKGMQRYRNEMEKDVQRTIAEKQRQATPGGFTDPNAMDAGFTRGTSGPIRQDVEQEAFLKSQSSGAEQEMPEDLIQFLQDMGPVVKRKEVTGPRLRKHQLEAHEHHREKREMPIMEETQFTTCRTTNFSRRQEEEDPLGLTGRELYQLLEADNPETTLNAQVEKSTGDDVEKQVYAGLLRDSMKYLQVPVIMKDTDDSYIGAWPESVNDLKRLKLTVVPESQVRLLLAVEDADEQSGQEASNQVASRKARVVHENNKVISNDESKEQAGQGASNQVVNSKAHVLHENKVI